jgi:hypothetical protein
MGRKYSLSFSAVSVSAAQDLFELVAATGKPIAIHEIRIGQTSDAGDAQDEMLQVSLIRGHATSGSGGTGSLTPASLNANDSACGITDAEINNTTVASTGTPVTVLTDAFNVRSGWLYMPTPECRPIIAAGTRFNVRITAPADAVTMSGTVTFEELS